MGKEKRGTSHLAHSLISCRKVQGLWLGIGVHLAQEMVQLKNRGGGEETQREVEIHSHAPATHS